MVFHSIKVILMLKTYTIKKNYEFRNILKKGKYYKGNYIDIYIKKNNRNYNNIGIAVGVKLAKAVKRNRIKRLIRENYRLIEKNLKIGNSIIFVCKKNQKLENINYFNIKEDMIKIFKKAELL